MNAPWQLKIHSGASSLTPDGEHLLMITDSVLNKDQKRGRQRIMSSNYFCTPPNKNTEGCDESELGEEFKKEKHPP